MLLCCAQYDAKAIGSGSEGAQTTLQEEYKPELSLKEAEVLALSTLKQVMEEKVRAPPGHLPAFFFVVWILTALVVSTKAAVSCQARRGGEECVAEIVAFFSASTLLMADVL